MNNMNNHQSKPSKMLERTSDANGIFIPADHPQLIEIIKAIKKIEADAATIENEPAPKKDDE